MLPTAGVNRVFGLLDLLRAYNGKTDVANLTIDLRIALDELLPIIDTAEYLALVAVQQGDISLADLGNDSVGIVKHCRVPLVPGPLQSYLDIINDLRGR